MPNSVAFGLGNSALAHDWRTRDNAAMMLIGTLLVAFVHEDALRKAAIHHP